MKEARGCFDSSWAMDLELLGAPLDGKCMREEDKAEPLSPAQ